MKKGILIACFSTITLFLSAQCIKGNCVSGKGVFKYQDGSIYEGNFKDRNFTGFGTMKYSNGNHYQGQWKNDLRWGKGVMKFTNGDIYSGHFVNDEFSGKGFYKFKSGEHYDGEWQHNLADGKGKYVFSEKERYEGSFVKGKFHGVGSFHYNDGSIFIGNWRDNKKNGEGKMHAANGTKIHGVWKNDELIERKESNHRIHKEVHNVSSSSQANRKKHWKDCNSTYCHNEQGEFRYQDGSFWRGKMWNGVPQGRGKLVYAGGNKYEGEMKNHAPHGEGVMYFTNGQVIGGTWSNGYPIKQKQQEATYNIADARNEDNKDYSEEVKIWAVIVGVSSYNHMPSLKYTDDDAYQMYAFLKSPEGGAIPNEQIQLLIDENATKRNILASMEEVLLKADENDVVLMYYSGHGLPGMFLPIDFDGYRNNLSHKEVMDIFNASPAKHKLCIADACHSGSLLASRSPFAEQLDGLYNEYEKTQSGTALIMSSKSEEVSLESSGLRQGIFSHYLIRGLNGEADSNKNGIITVSELFSFIDSGVRKYTKQKQRPSIAGNYDKDMPIGMVRK